MMRSVLVGAMAVVLMAAGVACGGDGDDADSSPASTAAQDTATEDTDSSADDSSTNDSSTGDQPSGAASGGAGTLTLGDEVIELERARCFLEEQDAAAGGGKILFVGQGFGTLTDGTEFVLDISRYDEDSQFTGDDIKVDVGDFRSEDFYSWSVVADLGTIEQDGSTLRAEGLTFRHSEDGSEITGAFEVNC
jgi:hypothetical protein